MNHIVSALPALEAVPRTRGERIELVSGTIVEEVLQDIAVLDFGDGVAAVANVALWRTRGEHSPLIGEFAFQIKFKRREDVNDRVWTRAEAFFLSLQAAAWETVDRWTCRVSVQSGCRAGPTRATLPGGDSQHEQPFPAGVASSRGPGMAT
jgi:hypothetical protein